MKQNDTLWLVGQIASLSVGFAVGATHTWADGLAVFYALCLLVDIREQISKDSP